MNNLFLAKIFIFKKIPETGQFFNFNLLHFEQNFQFFTIYFNVFYYVITLFNFCSRGVQGKKSENKFKRTFISRTSNHLLNKVFPVPF